MGLKTVSLVDGDSSKQGKDKAGMKLQLQKLTQTVGAVSTD